MPALPLLVHAVLLARLTAGFPFAVGETLQYDARLGMLPIGSATVSVSRMARERGTDAYVFAMNGQGGPPGVRVRYELTSWVGAGKFNSLRFYRKLVQGSSVDEESYEIVPDSGRYRQAGVAQEWMAPRDPLDELAFLYFLRTIPLQVGRGYSFSRYFKTGYNPIRLRVLAREAVALPDGRSVPCLLVEATARNMTMTLRLTDDARRLPVQLEVPLSYGTVTLELVSMKS